MKKEKKYSLKYCQLLNRPEENIMIDTNVIETKEDWWLFLDLHWDRMVKIINNTLELDSYNNFFQRKMKRYNKFVTKESLIKLKEERNPDIINILILTIASLNKEYHDNEILEVFDILIDTYDKVIAKNERISLHKKR